MNTGIGTRLKRIVTVLTTLLSMVGLLSILLLVLFAAGLSANPGLPPNLSALVPDDRRVEIEKILANPTFVRRLDFQVLADGRVYAFLLDVPGWLEGYLRERG